MDDLTLLIISYFIGSLSASTLADKAYSFLSSRRKHMPVRSMFSPWIKALIQSLDIIKGCLIALAANTAEPTTSTVIITALILGHWYSPWLRFKPQNITLPLIGIIIALAPLLLVYAALSYIAIIAIIPYRKIAYVITLAGLAIYQLFTSLEPTLALLMLIILIIEIINNRQAITRFSEQKEPTLLEELRKKNYFK